VAICNRLPGSGRMSSGICQFRITKTFATSLGCFQGSRCPCGNDLTLVLSDSRQNVDRQLICVRIIRPRRSCRSAGCPCCAQRLSASLIHALDGQPCRASLYIVLNAFRASQIHARSTGLLRSAAAPCAQRLSASLILSLVVQPGRNELPPVLNAFRHHLPGSPLSRGCLLVLNAFRHH
jgi:hypothetical protein